MDEDLKGSVDFDFFEDGITSHGDKPYTPPVIGKPPTPTKPQEPPADNLRFENKILQSYNKEITNESQSMGNMSSDTCNNSSAEVLEDRKSQISHISSSTNKSNNNMNFSFETTCSKIADESPDYIDDFESDSDGKAKNSHAITIPTESIDNDQSDIRHRTYSISSSSSAYSQCDQSDNEACGDSVGAQNKRNVTFSNEKHAKNSGRKSRLSSHIEQRKCKEENKQRIRSARIDKRISSKERASSDSSSEITDVSPLSSAESSPRSHSEKSTKHVGYIDYKRDRPCSDRSEKNLITTHKSKAKQDSMEFKLLMQAIKELDKNKDDGCLYNKRHKSADRKFYSDSERNYSFSAHQCKLIEQENKRLLLQLSKSRQPKRSLSTGLLQRRLPSSAVNRFREQRKIENDNFEFLKRLGNIRPTRGLTRNEQLSAYNKQMQYGLMQQKSAGQKSHSQAGSLWDDASVTSGPTSSGVSVRSGCSVNSRNSSGASSRGRSSASSTSRLHARPSWDDRW